MSSPLAPGPPPPPPPGRAPPPPPNILCSFVWSPQQLFSLQAVLTAVYTLPHWTDVPRTSPPSSNWEMFVNSALSLKRQWTLLHCCFTVVCAEHCICFRKSCGVTWGLKSCGRSRQRVPHWTLNPACHIYVPTSFRHDHPVVLCWPMERMVISGWCKRPYERDLPH